MLDLINRIKNGPPKRPVVARAQDRKPRGTWKAWSNADIATLREMAGKYPVDEIAKRLGRTPNAVGQRAHQLYISLAMRELDPVMIDMARVLRAAGYTPSQIIHAFNVPTESAKAIKRDLEDRK